MSVSPAGEHDQAPVQDGLVVELARDDVARKKFLKMAGKGMGGASAAAALSAFIAACGSSSSSTGAGGSSTGSSAKPSTSGDLGILNYALTLEYLESQFYAKVVKSGLFSSSPYLPTLQEFGSEESEHVTALISAIKGAGGTPVNAPKGVFPLHNATQVAKLAATVENLGAAAYLGQAPLIKDPKVLAAALSIHTVEARHAATLNMVVHRNPTPNGAFGKPMTKAQVLKVVTPFIAA